MISIKYKVKKKKLIPISSDDIANFINSQDIPHMHRCYHLKNQPLMRLSVCLKKYFIMTDIYPECKGCLELEGYRDMILDSLQGDNLYGD